MGRGRRSTDRIGASGIHLSIAVIVKNGAKNLREFILFYRAVGTDRIHLYDNDASDNLMEVLVPFLESGYVVYRKWPGQKVQTAACRDAVRRARRRTRWLAIVDADEFLFSPKGPLPEQLRACEKYPGIGANRMSFGPNGHDRGPEGLVMDAYTTTQADANAEINRHVESIVQPGRYSASAASILRSTGEGTMPSARTAYRWTIAAEGRTR